MLNKKYFLVFSTIGLTLLILGQVLAKSRFYGSFLGRSWAHVFWLGFLLVVAPSVIWFVQYIAYNRNPLIVMAGKYQLTLLASVTLIVGLLTLASIAMGNRALTGYDGDARRGVFVFWLLLIFVFTVINIIILAVRSLRKASR